MNFVGFTGPQFKSPMVNTAVSELINHYLEKTESPVDAAFPWSVLPRPGRSVFSAIPKGPIRGSFAQDTRTFVVGGDTLYELQGNGSYAALGVVGADQQPVSMDSNGHGGHQLCVISAGNGYIYDLASGVFQQIVDPSFPANAVKVCFVDTYFVVMQAATSKVFVSAPENGLVWNASNVISVSTSSDALQTIFVINDTLWMMGSQSCQPWVTTGALSIFAPMKNINVEFGVRAVWSVQQCDGTLCFVGQSPQGGPIVLQSQGYQFAKISTSDQDRVLEALPDASNVRAYSYTEGGHTYYVLCPNTGPAQVYDLATGLWQQWGEWNPGTASYDPLAQWCHCYGFGKHLVGDRVTGNVYEQSVAIGDDNGTPIRRVRTAPHITTEDQWNFGHEITIAVEAGLATIADPNPTLDISWSKDKGHTFSTPRSVSMGAQGQYAKRISIHRAPGRFSDFCLRVVTSALIAPRYNACYLRVTPGTGMR